MTWPARRVRPLSVVILAAACGDDTGMAARPDTGEPPPAGPEFDLRSLMVLDPLRSPTGPEGWTRARLGDDRLIVVQSTAIRFPHHHDLYRSGEVESWSDVVPLSVAEKSRTSGPGPAWGANAEGRLRWNRDGEFRWELTIRISVGLENLAEVQMHCNPEGARRLHCWWHGLGAAGPDQQPGDLPLHPNSHFWWTRYDHPDEVPQPTQAQALELYLLGGLGQ